MSYIIKNYDPSTPEMIRVPHGLQQSYRQAVAPQQKQAAVVARWNWKIQKAKEMIAEIQGRLDQAQASSHRFHPFEEAMKAGIEVWQVYLQESLEGLEKFGH